MKLEEIEEALQLRLNYMAKMDESPMEDWLRCYEVLAQVKQAQAAQEQNHLLSLIERHLVTMVDK